jgi:hypothetical protein
MGGSGTVLDMNVSPTRGNESSPPPPKVLLSCGPSQMRWLSWGLNRDGAGPVGSVPGDRRGGQRMVRQAGAWEVRRRHGRVSLPGYRLLPVVYDRRLARRLCACSSRLSFPMCAGGYSITPRTTTHLPIMIQQLPDLAKQVQCMGLN